MRGVTEYMEKKDKTQTKSLMQMDVKDLIGKLSAKKKQKKKNSSTHKFEMKKTVVAFDIGSSSIK